jgi:anti-sigma B factor antagonist
VLALSGELDVASAPELEQRLADLRDEEHERILIDLSGLTFVDSAGVSVLIRAKHDAESDGRRLVLSRPNEQVQNVFAVVGLATWLTAEA